MVTSHVFTIRDNFITDVADGGPTYTYEIVDKIPSGFIVWNIGHHAPDGYLPACVVRGHQIAPETLKAIPISKADYAIVSRACGHGCDSIKSTKRHIAFAEAKGNEKAATLYRKALEILERMYE